MTFQGLTKYFLDILLYHYFNTFVPSLTSWSDILPLNLNELEMLSLVKSAIALLLTKAGASQLVYDFEVSIHFEDRKIIQEKAIKSL